MPIEYQARDTKTSNGRSCAWTWCHLVASTLHGSCGTSQLLGLPLLHLSPTSEASFLLRHAFSRGERIQLCHVRPTEASCYLGPLLSIAVTLGSCVLSVMLPAQHQPSFLSGYWSLTGPQDMSFNMSRWRDLPLG